MDNFILLHERSSQIDVICTTIRSITFIGFRKWQYNNCFQMTSFDVTKVIQENCMPILKTRGEIYHLTGSLLPMPRIVNTNFCKYILWEIPQDKSISVMHTTIR
ncbi:Uncharacterized protein FWK35_00008852 [Aphis craccivora]|uniref:Uncharacterized protein n=1 Tax=Aphis craccivora TaxID=307492 RepID=A0A6G0YI91_APHCR|nr:Uncharacterized protein FWK35_00008852 [Aphis craccivora]